MNEHRLNDPALLALEARLAGMTPHDSADQQHEILYQCGLAAGQRAATRTLRRWQAVAAALLVTMIGISLPLAQGRVDPMARQAPATIAQPEVKPLANQQAGPPVVAGEFTPVEDLASGRTRQPPNLDAWQISKPADAWLAGELNRYRNAEPATRSLAVGSLTREFLGH